jgi:hypothetical protein
MNAIITGVILIYATSFFPGFMTEASGADWREYLKNDDATFYYDAENMRQVSKDMVRVWEKRLYSKESVDQFYLKAGEKYRELTHAVGLFERDCAEKKIRRLSLSYYSEDKLLMSDNQPDEWYYAIPDSVGEIFLKTVCK